MLLIPLTARAPNGTEDDYLLRLQFGYYREWPPSALFVNPATGAFAPGSADDVQWLPNVQDPTQQIAVHRQYGGNGYQGQLICCSATLEFYKVLHVVKQEHVWNGWRDTFGLTLEAVRRALSPECYRGRQAA